MGTVALALGAALGLAGCGLDDRCETRTGADPHVLPGPLAAANGFVAALWTEQRYEPVEGGEQIATAAHLDLGALSAFGDARDARIGVPVVGNDTLLLLHGDSAELITATGTVSLDALRATAVVFDGIAFQTIAIAGGAIVRTQIGTDGAVRTVPVDALTDRPIARALALTDGAGDLLVVGVEPGSSGGPWATDAVFALRVEPDGTTLLRTEDSAGPGAAVELADGWFDGDFHVRGRRGGVPTLWTITEQMTAQQITERQLALASIVPAQDHLFALDGADVVTITPALEPSAPLARVAGGAHSLAPFSDQLLFYAADDAGTPGLALVAIAADGTETLRVHVASDGPLAPHVVCIP